MVKTKKEGQEGIEAKKAKKPPYRPLQNEEREMLFAFYEKWNGNMLAMIRDHDSIFKGYTQVRYYADLYKFESRLVEIRQKRAKEVIASLGDSKILAIQQAIRLITPRQIPMKGKDGSAMTNVDGQPFFIEIDPEAKDVKVAWDIIKVELGEATTVGKMDHTTKGEKISGIEYVLPNAPKSNETKDRTNV